MRGFPKGWVETTLGNAIGFVVDNRGKTPPLSETGEYELLEVNAVSEGNREPDYSKVGKFVGKETFQTWFRKGTIKQGDTLIPTVGTIGNAAYSKEVRGAIAQNLIALRANENNDPLFLYYFMSSPITKKLLLKLDIGGVQPSIKVPHLLDMSVVFPPLPEQKAIAAVLSAFDDKIGLLREQNETLEPLAQTIFKEWFDHFNFPDQNGKPYRDHGGEMVDSELGEIPKGWRVGNVGDILELLYGRPLKAKDRTGFGFPVYGSNGVVGYHKDYMVKGPGIIIGRKGSMGEVTWCNESFYPIDTTFYVSNLLNVSGLFFHYFLLKRYDFEKIGSDSAVPGLNRNAVYLIDLIVPSLNIIEQFNNVANAIFKKIKNNTAQIQTLSKTRDTLLPKLMSGETRVKGFEQ